MHQTGKLALVVKSKRNLATDSGKRDAGEQRQLGRAATSFPGLFPSTKKGTALGTRLGELRKKAKVRQQWRSSE